MQMQNGDAAPADDVESSSIETDTADTHAQSRKGPRRSLVPSTETADQEIGTNGSSKTAIPASVSLCRAVASDVREKADTSAAETSNGHAAATRDEPHKTATSNGVDTTADSNAVRSTTADADAVTGIGAHTKRGPRGAKRAAPSAGDEDAPVAKRGADSDVSEGSQALPVAVTAPTAAATLHVQPLVPQTELAVRSVQLPASGSDYGAQQVNLSGLQVDRLAPQIKPADTAVSIALPVSNGHISLPQAVAVTVGGLAAPDAAAQGEPVPLPLPAVSGIATSDADEPPLKRPHLFVTSALTDAAPGIAPAPAPSAAVTSTASFGQHALGGDYSFSDAGNGWDEAVAEQGAVLAADRTGLAHAAPLH